MRLLSLNEVCAKVGMSRWTVRRLVNAGKFPRPRRAAVGPQGWLESEIDVWLKRLEVAA